MSEHEGERGDERDSRCGRVLDEEMFPTFSPLLAACQVYADLTGCRFRASSFDGFEGCDLFARYGDDATSETSDGDCTVYLESSEEEVDEPDWVVVAKGRRASPLDGWQLLSEEPRKIAEGSAEDPLLEAKRRAVPAVRRFARRLRRGDDARLLEEMQTAFHVTMEEALRRSMVATCQRLDMWPPRPAPRGVRNDDCEYQDLNAPVAVIAQRAFNDELRRTSDRVPATPFGSVLAASSRPYRRAMTATFIIEFAHEVGLKLPLMDKDQQHRLERFESKVREMELEAEQQRLEQQRHLLQETRCFQARPSFAGSVAVASREIARRILLGKGEEVAPTEAIEGSFESCGEGSLESFRQVVAAT
mmetsp:Transcript_29327/g.84283  ORF Transcript_29327/g.84283 Transcript_29327/m.84283 type:complete len:361 (+) Transcript_29327:115-1197(+)